MLIIVNKDDLLPKARNKTIFEIDYTDLKTDPKIQAQSNLTLLFFDEWIKVIKARQPDFTDKVLPRRSSILMDLIERHQ
jgi:hypothetical protein